MVEAVLSPFDKRIAAVQQDIFASIEDIESQPRELRDDVVLGQLGTIDQVFDVVTAANTGQVTADFVEEIETLVNRVKNHVFVGEHEPVFDELVDQLVATYGGKAGVERWREYNDLAEPEVK